MALALENAAGAWSTEETGGAPRGPARFSDHLAELLRPIADRNGDTAIVCGADRLSYAELDAAATLLAERLADLRLVPEQVVGLLMEPSIDMVVAVVATLRSRAAYLPLDRRDPASRQAYILGDSGAAALLVGDNLSPPSGWAGPTLRVGRDAPSPPTAASTSALPTGDEANAAYILYTSGSTGAPKGVVVPRGALANYLAWAVSFYAMEGRPAVVCTSLAYDLTITSLLAPLVAGGAVYLVGDGADALEHAVHTVKGGLNDCILKLTPTHLKMVESGLGRFPVGFSGSIIIGGEVLFNSHLRGVGLDSSVRLFNEYGPTETTVGCTSGPVSATDAEGALPVGSAVDETFVHLLNEDFEPCVRGEVGEIFIAGRGLARGYIGRSGQTAERFLPNPSGPPGSRMYRSGDLGRWRPDGQLEVIGRKDSQVKIRGHRVELEEIEAALVAHPYVRQAAVVAAPDEENGSTLAAYWAPEPGPLAALKREGDWGSDTVERWESVQDHIYTSAASLARPVFIGWDSSFTAKPLPFAELQTWLDHTVNRILQLSPRRVLEVGCGVGNVLARVAPMCLQYVGTELSGRGVDSLRAWLERQTALGHASVYQAEALDAFAVAVAPVDTVIFNSVIHHFPSAEYLEAALLRAIGKTSAGGHVFIGDVRSFELLDVFRGAVELSKAAPDVSAAELRMRADRAVLNEEELVVSPGFFREFAARHPRISAVDIQLKRGLEWNELVRYRYDVVLHVEGATAIPASVRVEGAATPSVTALLAQIEALEASVVEVCGVSNARLMDDVQQQEDLRICDAGVSLREFQRARRRVGVSGIEPEEVWREAGARGWQVVIAPSGNRLDRVDVVVAKQAIPGVPAPSCRVASLRGEGSTNDPLSGRRLEAAGQQLLTMLRQSLPEWMVPAAIIAQRQLPVARSGKVDRAVLRAPIINKGKFSAFIPPQTPAEHAMAGIWSQVLGAPRISRDDDFFDIGGHSLLATRVISLVREEFGLQAPLRTLFEMPTLAAFAAEIVRRAYATSP